MRAFRVRCVGVLCLSVILVGLGPSGATAAVMAYDDLWDVSRGTTISDHSLTKYFIYAGQTYSYAADMFGASNSAVEAGNTLWTDYYGAGTIHWVEWETPEPLRIERFNLVASHEDPYIRRSFDHFKLEAYSGGGWVTLYDADIPIPYGGGTNYTGITSLELNQPVASIVTAGTFRAEFTQYGDTSTDARGPRIRELDGYGTVVPEPATLALLAAGGLALIRRRRAA